MTTRWIGKTVTITGCGGQIGEMDGAIKTAAVATGRRQFVIERLSGNHVAFRLEDTNLYLTQTLYGENPRNEIASILSTNQLYLPDLIPKILDFLVGQATPDDNFEGAGYNYTPLSIEPGPPNYLQTFELVPVSRSSFGVRSCFGTFWRSQHWDGTVSQSPHLQRDETWNFHVLSPRSRKKSRSSHRQEMYDHEESLLP